MQNWKTTVSGGIAGSPLILHGLAGFFTSLSASGVPDASSIGEIIMGLGIAATGLFAKDATTHSTTLEVQQATREVHTS